MENIKTKICRVCKQEKLIVKFDQHMTKKGKVRKKTCLKCARSGYGYLKVLKDLQSQNLKKCSKCNEIKSLDNFSKYSYQCRECTRLYDQNNKKKRQEHYQEHKIEKQKYNKEYYENNKKHILQKNNEYFINRKINDIEFKLRCGLRSRLNAALKNNYKSGSAVADLMLSITDFKVYLEQKFYLHPITGKKMTWDNYGKKWEIDHIKALCLFDLTDRKQFLEAAHFSNLRPLWKEDHRKKTTEDMRLFVGAE